MVKINNKTTRTNMFYFDDETENNTVYPEFLAQITLIFIWTERTTRVLT